MGTVFKAQDRHLGRWVALKVLPPGVQQDAEVLERFKREAYALARLKHAGVAAVYDASVEGGFPYLVMEYVEGETLEQRLQREGPLPAATVARIGRELAEALDHIHELGVIHRDLKASNVMLAGDGAAVLTDFGIAFVATLPRISHGPLGTPEYMSPEQAEGRPLDGRADIYSLGVVLYEAACGCVPFPRQGDSLVDWNALLNRILAAPVPALREARAEVPGWLAACIERCLAKDPGERYRTGADLAAALQAEDASIGREVPTRSPRPTERTQRPEPLVADLLADDRPEVARKPGITLITHTHPVVALDIGPRGHWLATASADHAVRIWDLASGRLLHVLATGNRNALSVAFCSDRRTLASGDEAGRVHLWDAQAGQLRHVLEAHTALVMAVAFSPDGRLLATGGADGAIRMWDVASGQLIRTLGGHKGYLLALAFSADGTQLVSSGADEVIRIWTLPNGALRATLTGHIGYVFSVACSPDGIHLASGGADGAVRLWDLGAGKLLRTLGWHKAWIMAVDFSADGERLASAGRDHAVRLWNVADGVLDRSFEGHGDAVTDVAFSPTGAVLASAGKDHTVRIWSLSGSPILPVRVDKKLLWAALFVVLLIASLWANGFPLLTHSTLLPRTDAEPVPVAVDAAGPAALALSDDATARTAQATANPPGREPARRDRSALYGGDVRADAGGWTLVVATTRSAKEARGIAWTWREREYRVGVLPRMWEGRLRYDVVVGQFGRYDDAIGARRALAGDDLPQATWVARVAYASTP